MSNSILTCKSAVQPDFDALEDLKEFSGAFVPEEIGAALDCRMATRTSMPALWRPDNGSKDQSSDLHSLVKRAHEFNLEGNESGYEACMQKMLKFFTSGAAAPARSPAQVASAFQLPLNALLAEKVEKEMPYLSKKNLTDILLAECDIDQFDVLKEAEKERL